MHAFEPQARCPLDDVRVLDLSRLVVGNITTHVLADLGAEVVKVERPAGDDLRNWTTAGVPVWWQVYARNKKSLCLDLRAEAGRDVLLRLVESSQSWSRTTAPARSSAWGSDRTCCTAAMSSS